MNTKSIVENRIRALLKLRVETARKAMDEAQASANEESKSSAGDKYETGRAMAQNQRDMNARQWAEAKLALDNFEKAIQKNPNFKAGPGSLVKTEAGLFYLGPGIGKLELDNQETILALSIQSPLGKFLVGKKVGDNLDWMGKSVQIQEVW